MILSDGGLKCFGRNLDGMLGQGTESDIGAGINDMTNLQPVNLGTGKTASALIGVSGLKRAFAAAATVTARDDLQRIKGVGPFIAEKLNMLGITTFRQVANMTPELEDQVNTAIEFFPGRVRRDKWAAQAAKLADE